MIVQVPTPPVRYMLWLNFSLGLRFFFLIVVHYSYVTEWTQLNQFFLHNTYQISVFVENLLTKLVSQQTSHSL